jgi:hypothetical protein
VLSASVRTGVLAYGQESCTAGALGILCFHSTNPRLLCMSVADGSGRPALLASWRLTRSGGVELLCILCCRTHVACVRCWLCFHTAMRVVASLQSSELQFLAVSPQLYLAECPVYSQEHCNPAAGLGFCHRQLVDVLHFCPEYPSSGVLQHLKVLLCRLHSSQGHFLLLSDNSYSTVLALPMVCWMHATCCRPASNHQLFAVWVYKSTAHLMAAVVSCVIL